MSVKLETSLANDGEVIRSGNDGYLLKLPKLLDGKYGLAQVDDYMHLPRRQFPHQPPLRVQMEARVSKPELPGTWGFGLWNDPFSFGFGGGGMARVFPALPNAAWFFYGSQENHLSLRDDQPGSGFCAKTFRSPQLPSIVSLLAIPGLPFLLWPITARLLRRLARRLILEDVTTLMVEVAKWHVYELLWREDRVVFSVNQSTVLDTKISPQGRLGLVIWIDNQYFRFDTKGQMGFGFLEVPVEQWLEIRMLSVTSLFPGG